MISETTGSRLERRMNTHEAERATLEADTAETEAMELSKRKDTRQNGGRGWRRGWGGRGKMISRSRQRGKVGSRRDRGSLDRANRRGTGERDRTGGKNAKKNGQIPSVERWNPKKSSTHVDAGRLTAGATQIDGFLLYTLTYIHSLEIHSPYSGGGGKRKSASARKEDKDGGKR